MSIFRNLCWFAKGMCEYTKSGFESAAKKFDESEIANVRLDKKKIMITGANSGIGLSCCKALAKCGAEIHMVCRNRERAEQAKQEVIAACSTDGDSSLDKNPQIFIHTLDLALPRDVFAFGQNFIQQQPFLDILINNAGCMVNEKVLDSDGMEANFCTNTLGTYLLTEGLFPILLKSDDPRVITVTSGGMLVQKLDFADPMLTRECGKFDGTMVYAQNKRQQVVLTEMWASRLPEIRFYTMHPGWVDTPAVASSMPSFYRSMQGRLRSPDQGADTIIWLSSVKDLSKYPSGSFFQDRQIVAKHLPLAHTHCTDAQKQQFMTKLVELAAPFIVT